MLSDPLGSIRQIAEHLDIKASAETLDSIVEKSSFDYMKRNEDRFEMSAPTPFMAEGSFFVKGNRSREKDLSEEEIQKVRQFIKGEMAGASYPLAQYYSDVVGD
jgi:hypothetical protein